MKNMKILLENFGEEEEIVRILRKKLKFKNLLLYKKVNLSRFKKVPRKDPLLQTPEECLSLSLNMNTVQFITNGSNNKNY